MLLLWHCDEMGRLNAPTVKANMMHLFIIREYSFPLFKGKAVSPDHVAIVPKLPILILMMLTTNVLPAIPPLVYFKQKPPCGGYVLNAHGFYLVRRKVCDNSQLLGNKVPNMGAIGAMGDIPQ